MSRGVLIWDFDGTLATRPGNWTGALCEVVANRYPDLGMTPDRLRPHLQHGFPWHRPEIVRSPCSAGWHIDGSYKVGDQLYVNLRSRERALLMLFLFSDVGPDDAPTRIRVGSHLDVARILRSIGEGGMPFDRVVSHLPQLHDRPLAWATGRAGDVYLCHPFIVHAATWPHRGKAPRFIAQPPLSPVGLLDLDRADGDYSAVEIAVRIGLGLG